ncbi:MAG: LysR substrate-binding domain-containing protein [Cellvibrionaceae bacterium]|nr:LysR substrate-binding domain-containing protein [Cellvibrionaceae bacterium]
MITTFKKQYPKVHLRLHQGSPKEIAQLLLEGEADIGLATESLGEIDELVAFPFYTWRHAVVVPQSHPLASIENLTLAAIAEYPIITYHEGFTGRARVEKAFQEAGLSPDIIMSALDADVIKSYVELELGIGIIASVAFSPERDTALKLLDGSHLFLENETKLAVRKGHLLRRYGYKFIEMCSPELKEALVLSQVSGED